MFFFAARIVNCGTLAILGCCSTISFKMCLDKFGLTKMFCIISKHHMEIGSRSHSYCDYMLFISKAVLRWLLTFLNVAPGLSFDSGWTGGNAFIIPLMKKIATAKKLVNFGQGTLP